MFVKPFCNAISILILLFIAFVSCKEKATVNKVNDEQKAISEDSLELVDLENIPFKMPNSWIYVQNPIPSLPNITAQAADPTVPQTILAVVDYEANTINELMKMLVEDQKKIFLDHSYTIKKDTVYTTTKYWEQIFLGKGVYKKVNDKLRFIHLTTPKEHYENNLAMIDEVLGSVTFD